MKDFIDAFGIIGIMLLIGAVVLNILIVIAVLSIPKIARYQKAQAKILALMAKKSGIEPNVLSTILYQEKMLSIVDSDYVADLLKKPKTEDQGKSTLETLEMYK